MAKNTDSTSKNTSKNTNGQRRHNRSHGRRSDRNENRLGAPQLLHEGRDSKPTGNSRKREAKPKRQRMSPRDVSALVACIDAMRNEAADVLKLAPGGNPAKLSGEQQAVLLMTHQIRELCEKAQTAVETRDPKEAIQYVVGTDSTNGVFNLLDKFPIKFHLTGVSANLYRFVKVQQWALDNPLPEPGPTNVMQRGLAAIAKEIEEALPDVTVEIRGAASAAAAGDHWLAARQSAIASQLLSDVEAEGEEKKELNRKAGVLARFSAIQSGECNNEQRRLLVTSAKELRIWALVRAFNKAAQERAAAAAG